MKVGSEKDNSQAALFAALKEPEHSDPTIAANIIHLSTLHCTAPELRKQYLAASPAWHVARSTNTGNS